MKQGGTSTATIVPQSDNGSGLSLVDLPPHQEEVDSKLEQARDRLLALRRQQDELEHQKADLEELRRKQDEYARGKAEMIDNLTRGLVALEREQIQADRLAESCNKTQRAFREYLEQLQAVNDEEWTSATVRSELSRALGIIENSRLEFNRAGTKLDCLHPGTGQPSVLPGPESKRLDLPELVRYACIGAAASAPLIVAGTLWLILLLTVKH